MAPNVDINTTTTATAGHDQFQKTKTTLPYASQVHHDHDHDHLIRKPVPNGGSLNKYRHFEVTPIIGTEFPEVQLTDLLHDDTKIRDLAVTSK